MSSAADPIEKANEYAFEALKQIITLSSGVLALTITFIKDALGDARSHAIAKFFVPLSWFFLILSIWIAWLAMVDAANILGLMNDSTYAYVFGKVKDTNDETDEEPKREVKKRRKRGRLRAGLAQLAFALGMASLTIFALLNWSLFFTPSASSTMTPTAIPTLTVTVAPSDTPIPQTFTPMPTATVTP